MPSLGRDLLIEIFQQIIINENDERYINLSKFLLCGKQPFQMVSNYFSQVSNANLRLNKLYFKIERLNGPGNYQIPICFTNIPVLVIVCLHIQDLKICKSKNFEEYLSIFFSSSLKTVTLPCVSTVNYSDVFMSATNLQSVHFNQIHGGKLGIINLPSSCRELKFTNMSFHNSFNKKTSKNMFPFVEILKINGTFDGFEYQYREAFVDFIFNSFPNLKEIDILFNEGSRYSLLRNNICKNVNESVKDFKVEKNPTFKGIVIFSGDFVAYQDRHHIICNLNPPFNDHTNEPIIKFLYKSDNLEMFFIFNKRY